MDRKKVEQWLLVNEPAFQYGGKQYSVCSVDGMYYTWNSDGEEEDFSGVDNLLDNWTVGGKRFKDILDEIM